MQEHAEYAACMEYAGVVIRCQVGADRIGLGAEIDGDVQVHLPFDAFDAPGQFGPGQPAGRAAVQGLGKAGATLIGDEGGFEHIAVGQVAALGNERRTGVIEK